MPRYFFHTRHNDHEARDTEGFEIKDTAAVWSQAVRGCGEMVADLDGELVPDKQWKMTVEDESGEVVVELSVLAHCNFGKR
jgi:hypothetical protein